MAAQVTETYQLVTGATASEEQRTGDLVLYRVTAVVPPDVAQGFSPALSGFFPIAPSRSYLHGQPFWDVWPAFDAVRARMLHSTPNPQP